MTMTTSSGTSHGLQLGAPGTRVVSALSPRKVAKKAGRLLLYLTLLIGAIIISLPWVWMIISSLKSNAELHGVPFRFFPKEIHLENFVLAFFPSGGVRATVAETSIWPRLLLNTMIIAFFVEIGVLLSSSMVAFSVSRLRWRGRTAMFYLVLASMMLPSQVTLIPQYLLYTKVFGWVNTWYPQIVPQFFGAAWAIFLLRQFMMTIPVEIDEAARLDGCNDWQLYWRVIMPMCRPALGAIAIFTFTYVWGDLFTPLLYVRDIDMGNMATGMAIMRQASSAFGDRFPRDELSMAAAVIVSLPLVIMFFIFQKHYIQGVVVTGIK